MTKPLGLYIHIPFCEKKCQYCIFYSTINFNHDVINKYINNIICQIKKYSYLINKNYYIDTIYFGGGSPSSISYKYIDLILKNIYYYFNVINDVEVTLECNPKDLNKNYIYNMSNSNINRISLGIQSLISNELKLLDRDYYNINNIYNIINLLNSININNISVDLMYAIPYQSLQNILYSVDTITTFNIQHISVYNFEPHNKKFKELIYPSENLQFKMYCKICNILFEKKFYKYEISNFSKLNFLCKHNMKYWNLNDYLGLGAGAHSFLNKKRFSNKNNLFDFIENLKYDHYNINLFEDYIILKIRTSEGIDLKYIDKNFNINIDSNKINILLEKNLLYKQKNNYILTELGCFMLDYVINEILV